MDNLCIATGWHSNGVPANPMTAIDVYRPDWLVKWDELNHLPVAVPKILYISECSVMPYDTALELFNSVNYAVLANSYYHTRHDWSSSMLTGMMYAYNNNLDLVYIEQDCLVKNVAKAVQWARGNAAKMVYGFGEVSYSPTWAEHCFVYISRNYVEDALIKALYYKIDREAKVFIEVLWHELYREDSIYWPFGYGRKRVLDWNTDVFYKQQITSEDLEMFKRFL